MMVPKGELSPAISDLRGIRRIIVGSSNRLLSPATEPVFIGFGNGANQEYGLLQVYEGKSE